MGYKPHTAVHPGKTLEEHINFIGMSQRDLADRTNLTPKTINEIVKGKAPITTENAIRFENVLRIPASFLNNLQKNYHEIVARIEAEKQIEEEIIYAKKYTCYDKLAEWNLVDKTKDYSERVKELLKYFGVSSLKLVSTTEPIAFKKIGNRDISQENLAAWLQWGEIDANNLELSEYNREKAIKCITKLKSLTLEEPSYFSKELRTICASFGVVVIYTPYLSKTYVSGATKWYKNNPLIQLSLLYKTLDIFWFTFFHELGHIIEHGKKAKFIEFEGIKQTSKEEEEANQFAKNQLIPENQYGRFILNNDFSGASIKKFANELHIHKSIVAGRLAKEGKVAWSAVSFMRPRLEIKKEAS